MVRSSAQAAASRTRLPGSLAASFFNSGSATFAAKGADYADAPVARTRAAAEAGTLAISVGATRDVFARIENVLDAEYETFGLLGEPDEVFEDFEDPRFNGAGPPRGVWVGLRLKF